MQVYDKALFETKFNDVNHTVELYLDSSDGESDNQIYKYPINPNSVVNLTIEDTLADWIIKGHLTFFYNPEAGTGEIDYFLGQNRDATTGISSLEPKPFYSFRNDGKDRLRIRVIPNLEDTNIQEQTSLQGLIISDRKHWSLSGIFSVYDVEDIGNVPGAQNASSTSIKCLKIYFWDEWYQKMLTNHIEYSTAKSNSDQKLKTGLAMKEIIEKGLKNGAGSYLDSTDGQPINEDEWEEGSSNIFFTTPVQTTAYESLMYVYNKHASEKFLSIPSFSSSGVPKDKAYDFSLLIKERGPDEYGVGQLTLKPVSTFFEKAGKGEESPGPYQMEHFFVQSYGNTEKGINPFRAPFSKKNSDTIDFKSLKYSVISNYRFVDIAAAMNFTNFCTTPVYSFDFKNRMFNIEFGANSVETARKFIAEKYIKNLYINSRGDIEKLFLITLDNDKKQKNNTNIKPTFSLYGDEEDFSVRQSDGLKKMLYCGLFQNACINFKTLGLSFREPGRFIAIDKTEGVDSGDFPDKFYGQWFVINVRHVFESEAYYNDITAVKIYRFDEQSFKFPGTF